MPSPSDVRRRVALFDLDGTLVDSLPDLTIALNKLLAEEGRRILADAEVRLMVGDGATRLVERGFAATGTVPETVDGLVERFLAHYEGHAAANTRPFDGVAETLTALRRQGWRFAVCTNKPYRPSVEILEELGLSQLIDVVIGGDSTPWKKPDGRPVLAALEALHARPEDAVFVGDSPNDVGAGRAVGLPVVIVTFGYSRVPVAEIAADRLIDHFSELPRALDELA